MGSVIMLVVLFVLPIVGGNLVLLIMKWRARR